MIVCSGPGMDPDYLEGFLKPSVCYYCIGGKFITLLSFENHKWLFDNKDKKDKINHTVLSFAQHEPKQKQVLVV